MDIRKGQHCTYSLNYHIVLVVKYRKSCITNEMGEYLMERSRIVIEGVGGILLEGNHDVDHIHLLVSLPPALNLAEFIGTLKNTTSRMVRKIYADELKQDLWGGSFWTSGYYVSTAGGAPLETVKKYIEDQGKPKRKYVKRKKPV